MTIGFLLHYTLDLALASQETCRIIKHGDRGVESLLCERVPPWQGVINLSRTALLFRVAANMPITHPLPSICFLVAPLSSVGARFAFHALTQWLGGNLETLDTDVVSLNLGELLVCFSYNSGKAIISRGNKIRLEKSR